MCRCCDRRQHNKIIDFEFILKPKKHVAGMRDASSNGMEVVALRNIIERLKNNQRIIGYVHDNDSKASSAIRAAGWEIEQFFDPNHISKAFDCKWPQAPKSHLRGPGAKIREIP
jgi:hypothetical protein